MEGVPAEGLITAGGRRAFVCNPEGNVDLDQLSDRARTDFLYARAVVGRELAFPALRASGLHCGGGEGINMQRADDVPMTPSAATRCSLCA